MMVAVGKTMSYSGQQRLAIRVPLVRLYQARREQHLDSYLHFFNKDKVFIRVTTGPIVYNDSGWSNTPATVKVF